MIIAATSKIGEFFGKITAAAEKAWWIILLAGLSLFAIMLLVVAYKNRRIGKLKRELKTTRTKLEVTREMQDERAQKRGKTAEADEEQIEFDGEQAEPNEDAEMDSASQTVAYYNKSAVVSQKGGTVKFTVVYDRPKDSWVIRKAGVDRVVRRVDTKEEAMRVARALCKKYDANLVVHKKDGKFQKS